MSKKIEKYKKKYGQMKDEFETWRTLYQDLSDYIFPRKGRYLNEEGVSKTNDGSNLMDSIYNSAATKAKDILAAGMMSGLVSPSKPWFALETEDEELAEYGPVRDWLHDVRNQMLNVYARSNFYNVIHGVFEELAVFGTGSGLIEEDFDTVIRLKQFTVGEYMLALGPTYRVDTLMRRYAMTPRQMIERFGEDKVSERVKSRYEAQGQDQIVVVHVVQPNDDVDPERVDHQNMEFSSDYYELRNNEDRFLMESGYRGRPFFATRWDATGSDVYGRGPGHTTLPDVKMVQKIEELGLKGFNKMVDPPMNAPWSMKGRGGNILPGAVNYIDTAAGNQMFQPAQDVRIDFNNVEAKIQIVVQRIRENFFNDMFLMIANAPPEKNMTATEVAERHEEKLVMLGPVLERLQSELLDVCIYRTFNIMRDFGLIPPAPQELEQANMKIEYISTLARAQRMVGLQSIDRLASFTGELAPVFPSAVDKINIDEAIDQYAQMLGTPPKVVNSDDKVKKIRELKQMQQQAMAMAQSADPAKKGAEALKTASETKVGDKNLIDMVSQQAGGRPA